MTHAGNFEDYMKSAVLDLSQIESNRRPEKKENEKHIDYQNYVVGFTGSKLWLDLELDSANFLMWKSHATCVNFCFDTNLQRHIQRVKEDESRAGSVACLYNCLTKTTDSANIIREATKSHPRNVRNLSAFAKLEDEVRLFNEDYMNKKKNYSF